MDRSKRVGCHTILLAISAICLIAVVALFWEIRNSAVRQQETRPVKVQRKDFYVVVFPKREGPPIQRAVFLRLDELMETDEQLKDTFEVYVGDNPVSMDSARFTAVPDESFVQHDIDQLNRQFELWGANTSWKRVEYFINRHGNQGESVVKLKLYSKRGDRFEYLYRVTPDGRVIPIWSLIYNRI